MNFLIWLLLILGGAVALSLFVGSNEGYVLLVQPPYRIELSLNLLVILLLLTFVAMHALLRLVQYTLRLPEIVRSHKRQQRQKIAFAALTEGLRAFVEGRYARAEKAAANALELGEEPALSALLAARAAHKLKHYGKRDLYLAEAERLAPGESLARLLTQAELLLDERQYAQALAPLQRIDKIEPHHVPALKLQLKAHQRLGNWEHVLGVLAQLEKRGAIEPVHLQQALFQAHQQLLERRAGSHDDLLAYWKKLPEAARTQVQLARLAARLFLEAEDGTTAAQIVEAGLAKNWDSTLAALYGDCASDNTLRQLEQAEKWLQNHANDAGLLLSLGHLCLRQELWGKAQSYLEASLSVQPGSAAHLALARLLERQGKQEDAYQHYRLSLEYALR